MFPVFQRLPGIPRQRVLIVDGSVAGDAAKNSRRCSATFSGQLQFGGKRMRPYKVALVTLLVLASAHSASAKDRSAQLKPMGSPGAWVGDDDYPPAAMRYGMTGITAFRLTVDPSGKPVRCDITSSSGFDVLDTTTCERLMAKARFTPARDKAGRPVAAGYSNRVRWMMPDGAQIPVSESLMSLVLSIDQTGNAVRCRALKDSSAEGGARLELEDVCKGQYVPLSPVLGMELRGSFQGTLAEVQIDVAYVFTAEARARILAPKSGFEQRGLYIHAFTVTNESKVGECRFEEQRGSILLAQDFCSGAQRESFDPPFAAIGKDGLAHGWYILRALLKTNK